MIETNNISKWYGPIQVLNDCSVNINKGDVVVVCGPSGSGKSTPIKIVTSNCATSWTHAARTTGRVSILLSSEVPVQLCR